MIVSIHRIIARTVGVKVLTKVSDTQCKFSVNYYFKKPFPFPSIDIRSPQQPHLPFPKVQKRAMDG